MKAEQLTKLINMVYDAVDNSKAGPIMSTDKHGVKICHVIGQGAFLSLLQVVVPRPKVKLEGSEPKEKWE